MRLAGLKKKYTVRIRYFDQLLVLGAAALSSGTIHSGTSGPTCKHQNKIDDREWKDKGARGWTPTPPGAGMPTQHRNKKRSSERQQQNKTNTNGTINVYKSQA